jgi:hypothetical protein
LVLVTRGLVVVVAGGVEADVVVESDGVVVLGAVVVVDDVIDVDEDEVEDVDEDEVEDVDEDDVLVSVEVVVVGVVWVDVDVVVDVVVDGLVQDVGSPLSSSGIHPGRSSWHHAAAQTPASPEAEASGPAPCKPTSVNTAPAVSTPM